MSDLPCDCCQGPQALTPQAGANRPGLSRLSYRAGSYASFLDSMRVHLSSAAFFADVRKRRGHAGPPGLATRDPGDFAMALLDAWAVTADVLTFYQERIANEGYLRCATERRSVLELARLAGYAVRPGVAASVYLAYTLEKDAAPVEIPKGARVNSVPGPGEQMQAFETAEPLAARVEWNELAPRMSRPLLLTASNAAFLEQIRFKGVATGLSKNDVLLCAFGRQVGEQVVRKVAKVAPDNAAQQTVVTLQLPTRLKPILAAWSDVTARYADLTWRCLPASEALDKVTGAMLALRTALDAMDSDPDLQLAQFDLVTKQYEQFKAAAKALLEQGDKEVLAWLMGYHLESGRYLSAGLFSESELRASFAKQYELPQGGPRSTLSQNLVAALIPKLAKPRSLQPANSKHLAREVNSAYSLHSDTRTRLLTSLQPKLARGLYQAWRNIAVGAPAEAEVFAMRVQAPLFGHNAQKRTQVSKDGKVKVVGDWKVVDFLNDTDGALVQREETNAVHLDAVYGQILPNSWMVVSTPTTRLTNEASQVFWASRPNSALTRAQYGMTGRTTRIELLRPALLDKGSWIEESAELSSDTGNDFEAIRRTVVFAGGEKLELAEMPIGDDVCGEQLELAGLYEGLEAGRWIILSGERTDLKDEDGRAVGGVMASELVMISAVTQDVVLVEAPPEKTVSGVLPAGAFAGILARLAPETAVVAANGPRAADQRRVALPGDRVHTRLQFATALAYKFRRESVKIRANVVRATHGETQQEVLGSGDPSRALQAFALKHAPLTFVSAPTVAGIASTLVVRVNDIEWHEADSLAGLGPRARSFVTRTGDDGKTSVVFGNGHAGARLPSGQENVRAVYRSGIGKPGNVNPEQISLLATRPLGVKGVINPLRASGGADPESRDQARRNVPLALMALDRLVSVQDHADFARTFGGVGKASAAARSDGRGKVVCLTIAGADDIPIEPSSDLLRNLRAALHRFGDPALPVRLQVRERLALVISARVRLEPDYLWEAIEARIRVALLAAFSFDALELGQDLFASAAIAVLQGVPGVAYVDLDVFDSVAEKALLESFSGEQAMELERKERIAVSLGDSTDGVMRPARIAYLSPEVADTLILQEIST